MRKSIAIIILAALLVGCTAGNQAKQVALASPFNGGTQGLSLSFQNLRKEVFDGGRDPFDIVVNLQNNGEELVTKDNIRVKLSGINPTEFSKTQDQLTLSAPDDIIEVRKDTAGNILPGPPAFVTFQNFNHNAQIQGATAQFTVRADACYVYKTRAVTKMCVRENLLTPAPNGICEINEAKTMYNSGAPVQFTNFKESTRSKDKVGFTVDLANSGGGDIFDKVSWCDRSDRKNQDRVYVAINTGLSGLQCTGLQSTDTGAAGYVTLYGSTNTISCSQAITTASDFEQLVNLEASYDYEQNVQDTIAVKSSGQ